MRYGGVVVAVAAIGGAPVALAGPDQHFQLVAAHSGKCLDVTGASQRNGALVRQWPCGAQDNQIWRLTGSPGHL